MLGLDMPIYFAKTDSKHAKHTSYSPTYFLYIPGYSEEVKEVSYPMKIDTE